MRYSLILVIILALGMQAKSQTLDDYRSGHYYDLKGTKHSGLIYCPNSLDFIDFKSHTIAKKERIKLDDMTALVLDDKRDSLVVKTEDNKDSKKYLAKLVTTTPQYKIYSRFEIYTSSAIVSTSMGAAPPLAAGGRGSFSNTSSFTGSRPGTTSVKQIFMYEEGNTTHEINKGNYVAILSKAFADNPNIAKQIESKYIKFNDLQGVFNRYNETK